MNVESTSKLADFSIRVIMLVSTIIALLFFAERYNQLVFSALTLIFLISLIAKGIADFIISRKKK